MDQSINEILYFTEVDHSTEWKVVKSNNIS